MRQIFTLLFILTSFGCFAQTDAVPNVGLAADLTPGIRQVSLAQSSPAPGEVFRKNILKINLSSLAFKNYSLSYERSLTRKVTLVAGVGHMPETNAASLPILEKILERFPEESEDAREELGRSTIGYRSYTGEIRFYTGKKPGARGFYVSLYGRHMGLDAFYTHEYEADSRTYEIPIDGRVTGLGGGLMLGSQWLIARRVTFDWYIIGAHFGKMKLDLDGRADLSTLTPAERRELEEEIESLDDELPWDAGIDATVTGSGVTVKGNAPFAGIRGLGFSLGIAF